MTDTEFNPVNIVNKLMNLKMKVSGRSSNANAEPQPVEVLRAETAALSKEISKFRACDGISCFYCREWAQHVYKKSYAWGASRGQSTASAEPTKPPDNEPAKSKQHAVVLCEQYYQISRAHSEKLKEIGVNADAKELVDRIVTQTWQWMKAPSVLYPPPDMFATVEFDGMQDRIRFPEDETSPVRLLETVTIEKTHCQLTKENFYLLKYVTRSQLLDQVQPSCCHTRPEWKIPSDLEVDRRVFNDQMQKQAEKNDKEVKVSLAKVWEHVNEFLDEFHRLDCSRDDTFGTGVVSRLNEFLREYKEEAVPFAEHWAPVAEPFKKGMKGKKDVSVNAVDEIDAAFKTYINNCTTVVSIWEEGFIETSYEHAYRFAQDVLRALSECLDKAQSRFQMGRIAEVYKDIVTKLHECNKTVNSIKTVLMTRVLNMRTKVTRRQQDLRDELKAIEEAWLNDSHGTLHGRLEKATNKDFRRRIKRFESAMQSTRQWGCEAIGLLFTPSDYVSIFTKCLELLMMEGEMWEAVNLGMHYKRHESTAQQFKEQREQLEKDFQQGIETGRMVLAGIVGRAFLKEAHRLQEETLALKKQDEFLQSLDLGKESAKKNDVNGADGSSSSKKSKKKKRKSINVGEVLSQTETERAKSPEPVKSPEPEDPAPQPPSPKSKRTRVVRIVNTQGSNSASPTTPTSEDKDIILTPTKDVQPGSIPAPPTGNLPIPQWPRAPPAKNLEPDSQKKKDQNKEIPKTAATAAKALATKHELAGKSKEPVSTLAKDMPSTTNGPVTNGPPPNSAAATSPWPRPTPAKASETEPQISKAHAKATKANGSTTKGSVLPTADPAVGKAGTSNGKTVNVSAQRSGSTSSLGQAGTSQSLINNQQPTSEQTSNGMCTSPRPASHQGSALIAAKPVLQKAGTDGVANGNSSPPTPLRVPPGFESKAKAAAKEGVLGSSGKDFKLEASDVRSGMPKPPALNGTNGLSSDHEEDDAEYREYAKSLEGLARDDLVQLVHGLQKEKAQLVSTLVAMQHEVRGLDSRYSEIVEMARTREVQLQMRYAQDMEEAKKYITMLEGRLQQVVAATQQQRQQPPPPPPPPQQDGGPTHW